MENIQKIHPVTHRQPCIPHEIRAMLQQTGIKYTSGEWKLYGENEYMLGFLVCHRFDRASPPFVHAGHHADPSGPEPCPTLEVQLFFKYMGHAMHGWIERAILHRNHVGFNVPCVVFSEFLWKKCEKFTPVTH
jgi:hypothetical protein